jgi:hypothetical protein
MESTLREARLRCRSKTCPQDSAPLRGRSPHPGSPDGSRRQCSRASYSPPPLARREPAGSNGGAGAEPPARLSTRPGRNPPRRHQVAGCTPPALASGERLAGSRAPEVSAPASNLPLPVLALASAARRGASTQSSSRSAHGLQMDLHGTTCRMMRRPWEGRVLPGAELSARRLAAEGRCESGGGTDPPRRKPVSRGDQPPGATNTLPIFAQPLTSPRAR